jgi:hypothetical protein
MYTISSNLYEMRIRSDNYWEADSNKNGESKLETGHTQDRVEALMHKLDRYGLQTLGSGVTMSYQEEPRDENTKFHTNKRMGNI